MLAEIADSKGDELIHDSTTLGGATLEQHSNNTQTSVLIDQGTWDFVVLQEQSQLPSFPIGQVEAEVFPFATSLCNMTRQTNDCGMPLFMMTWGREDGDQQVCPDWPPVCTYAGMQDLLSERYLQMAFDNDAWCAPVGEVWRAVREETDDAIDLYSSDGSHPSTAGTYLAACVFYATIWGESPLGSDYYADLSEEDAQYLQAMAASIVLLEAEQWNIRPLAWGELLIEEGLPPFTEVTFNSSSYVDSAIVTIEGIEYNWTDGEVSALSLSGGTYDYTIELFSSCGDELIVGDFEIETSISELDELGLKVYPNPAESVLNIEGVGNEELDFYIYDTRGKIVKQGKLISSRVDISDLPIGNYTLGILKNQKRSEEIRFVKIN